MSYAVVSATPEKRGAYSITTQSSHGNTACNLLPTDHRILGNCPLHGELMLRDKTIAIVSIQNEMNTPLIRAESDGLELLAEREPFRDSCAPVFFKSKRHGILAKAKMPQFSLSELWGSRFGFDLSLWGSIEASEPLEPETECVLQFVMSAYEFIWTPRHDSNDSIGS